MLTPCIGCRTLIPVGTHGRCPRCTPRSPQMKVRSSRAWTRESKVVRDRGICEMCGTRQGPFQADHIVRLEDDIRSVKARCLCLPCHKSLARLTR